MSNLIFDASALITAAKFVAGERLVLDYILDCARIVIPEEVRFEAIDQGLAEGYSDAQELAIRLKRDAIIVAHAPLGSAAFEDVLDSYGVESGDKAVIRLCCHRSDYAHVIVDDRLLYIILNRFKTRPLFLPGLVEWMVENQEVTREQGKIILSAIRSRYRRGFIEHSLKGLEEEL